MGKAEVTNSVPGWFVRLGTVVMGLGFPWVIWVSTTLWTIKTEICMEPPVRQTLFRHLSRDDIHRPALRVLEHRVLVLERGE